MKQFFDTLYINAYQSVSERIRRIFMAEKRVTEKGLDGVGFLNADWGNRLNKQMQAGKTNTLTVMENLVLDLNKTAWEQKMARYKHRPAEFTDTVLFALKRRIAGERKPAKDAEWLPVMVGNAAKHHGKPKAQTGEVKYTYDYLGKIACANFMRQWPDGHDNIVLHIAHPSQSIGQIDYLLDTVIGTHRVLRVDGEEIKFTVREAIPWDEPSGGIVSFLIGEKAQYNPYDLRPGDLILVVDIGGGVTSLTRVLVERGPDGKMKLQPIYDSEQSPSFDTGIRHVMDKLASELKETHEAFKSIKKEAISDSMLEEALLMQEGENGKPAHFITLWGSKVEVTQQVMNSDYTLLDSLGSIYQDRMANGAPFKLAVLTGGGNKSLYRQVTERLSHPNIETATKLENLYLANLYGGDEIFRQWIASQG